MSTDLVTLAYAEQHSRIDTTDPMLPFYITAASDAVLAYITDKDFIDSAGDIPVDSSGEPIGVPARAQMATLLWIEDFYSNRGPEATDPVPSEYGFGYPPRAVAALLYTLRLPTLA